jgi:Holliday junction resolvase RusA-like endonuclease
VIIEINSKLPNLNDYISAERRNRFMAAKMKKDCQDEVLWQIKKLAPITEASFFHFLWVEKTSRRDPDNVCAFGRKVILDALQEAGVLPNDNRKWVLGFSDTFSTSSTEKILVQVSPTGILPMWNI